MEGWDWLVTGLALPLVAAFVGSWLWTVYDTSDFAARRSMASIKKRITKLENQVIVFEAISRETNLKERFGQLIRQAVFTLALL
jgi:hypothetical protein